MLDVMDEASDLGSVRLQSLIRRPIGMFGGMSCLEIADISNNRKFISNKAVTVVIDQIWNGIVNPEVGVLRVTHLLLFIIYHLWSINNSSSQLCTQITV